MSRIGLSVIVGLLFVLLYIFVIHSHTSKHNEHEGLYSVECSNGGKVIFKGSTQGQPRFWNHDYWVFKQMGTDQIIKTNAACVISGWKE